MANGLVVLRSKFPSSPTGLTASQCHHLPSLPVMCSMWQQPVTNHVQAEVKPISSDHVNGEHHPPLLSH